MYMTPTDKFRSSTHELNPTFDVTYERQILSQSDKFKRSCSEHGEPERHSSRHDDYTSPGLC